MDARSRREYATTVHLVDSSYEVQAIIALACIYCTNYLIHTRLTHELAIGQVDSCARSTRLRVDFGRYKQQVEYNLTLHYDPRGLVMHPSVGVSRAWVHISL